MSNLWLFSWELYDRKKGIDACTDLDYTVNKCMGDRFARKRLNLPE